VVQDDSEHQENRFKSFRPGTGRNNHPVCIERACCPPLSESADRTAADAQRQYREARNSWSPCVSDERTIPGRDGKERGACGQRGRRFPPESHGEPGCGSAKLNLCGHANWIGIAPIAAGAIVERPGPAEARHPIVTEENQPESVSQQVNEYCGRAAPAVESARAALS